MSTLTASTPVAEAGQTITYDDPGVWGITPSQDRVGVVVSVEPSRYHDYYYLVQTEGFNLPRRITERQITGFVARGLFNEAAEISAAEADISAA